MHDQFKYFQPKFLAFYFFGFSGILAVLTGGLNLNETAMLTMTKNELMKQITNHRWS